MPAPGNPSGLNLYSHLGTENSSESTALHPWGRTHSTARQIQKNQRGTVTPTPGEDKQQVDWRDSEERRQTRKNKQKG